MTGRARLLPAAAATGWSALAVAAATSVAPPALTLVAALCVPLLWLRRGWPARWVPLVVGLACVVLVAGSRSVVAAAGVGTLVLLHVVLADLAGDAVDSSAAAVRHALFDVLPGLLAGAAAAVFVALLLMVTASAGTGGSAMGAGLWLLSPFLLLVAALLALGIATRRPSWWLVEDRRGLSALTRRYLDRVARRE